MFNSPYRVPAGSRLRLQILSCFHLSQTRLTGSASSALRSALNVKFMLPESRCISGGNKDTIIGGARNAHEIYTPIQKLQNCTGLNLLLVDNGVFLPDDLEIHMPHLGLVSIENLGHFLQRWTFCFDEEQIYCDKFDD